MSTEEQPLSVLDGIKAMPESQVECRTFGHAWSPSRTIGDRSGITIELDCTRCGTTRTDRVSKADGELEGRSYGYVAGYRGHKATRSLFRFEFSRRALRQ